MKSSISNSLVLARFRSIWLRVEPIAVWVIYAEWAFWIGLVLTQAISSFNADSSADWLVASAALDGHGPYVDLRDLSRIYDVPFLTPGWMDVGDAPWIHPRTPGALLVLIPTTLAAPETIHTVVAAVSLVLLAILGATCLPKLMNVRWPLGLLLAAALIVSGPVIRSMQFGSWSVALALILGWVWLMAREHDGCGGGLLLGLAIGMRLFPALLLIPMLLYRRWKISITAVAVAVGLNLLGMVVLGISPREVVDGMVLAGDTWIQLQGNASIIKPIFELLDAPSLLIVAALSAVVAAHSWLLQTKGASFDHVMALAMIAMLLLSPLSWEHYDAALFAVVALFLASGRKRILRLAALAWLLLMTVGFFFRQPWEQGAVIAAGLPSLVGRIGLLVALVLAGRLDERAELPDRFSFSEPSQP
jgi:alpha-1,2-mannosyltransferase